jgi:hypothetical protein
MLSEIWRWRKKWRCIKGIRPSGQNIGELLMWESPASRWLMKSQKCRASPRRVYPSREI